MPKLQMIERRDGTRVFSVNIPLEFIENTNWTKGQKLEASFSEGTISFSKKENQDGESI